MQGREGLRRKRNFGEHSPRPLWAEESRYEQPLGHPDRVGRNVQIRFKDPPDLAFFQRPSEEHQLAVRGDGLDTLMWPGSGQHMKAIISLLQMPTAFLGWAEWVIAASPCSTTPAMGASGAKGGADSDLPCFSFGMKCV
jgi:hypothetical protein